MGGIEGGADRASVKNHLENAARALGAAQRVAQGHEGKARAFLGEAQRERRKSER